LEYFGYLINMDHEGPPLHATGAATRHDHHAAKERPEAAKVQPERFINTTLLKELDDSGFIDGLYR
jgi:hypothetical protein